eukprot:10581551-Ditylum_brightwellii.AAC.1
MSGSNIDSSYTSDEFGSDSDACIYDCDENVSDADNADTIALEEPETDDDEEISFSNYDEETNIDEDESLGRNKDNDESSVVILELDKSGTVINLIVNEDKWNFGNHYWHMLFNDVSIIWAAEAA